MGMCIAQAVAGIKMTIQMYHNPNCTKSRLTLALLEEKGVDFELIEYLKNPPTAAELEVILQKLGKAPLEFMRTGEAEFKQHIQGQDLSRAAMIDVMVAYPKLIERPVVVNGDKAAVGRPPELVLPVLEA
ncbi:MAG: arsenate reductase (glutaredoxin) [Mariprofundaceae bacterium]|nr:arsenate reductase (glutaredoxin) [Mariprofundaceae bacterium]